MAEREDAVAVRRRDRARRADQKVAADNGNADRTARFEPGIIARARGACPAD